MVTPGHQPIEAIAAHLYLLRHCDGYVAAPKIFHRSLQVTSLSPKAIRRFHHLVFTAPFTKIKRL